MFIRKYREPFRARKAAWSKWLAQAHAQDIQVVGCKTRYSSGLAVQATTPRDNVGESGKLVSCWSLVGAQQFEC